MSHISADQPKSNPSIAEKSVGAKGPGELSVALSHLKSHLLALGSDETLPDRTREELRKYYHHECEKIQTELKLLSQQQWLLVKEEEANAAAEAVKFAGSEAGGKRAREIWRERGAKMALGGGGISRYQLTHFPEDPRQHELSRVRGQYNEAANRLADAQREVDATASVVANLKLNDSNRGAAKAEAERWELRQRWETITPPELQPAVRAIRKAFEDRCWEFEESTMKLCFSALHPQETGSLNGGGADLTPYRNFLVRLLGTNVRHSLLGSDKHPSQLFRAYIDVYETGIKMVARSAFQQFFEIAKAKTTSLGFHPAEWARKQVSFLITAQKSSVRNWIKNVCDRHVPSESGFDEEDDIYWGSWRAPKFICMVPAGNISFDATKAWDRNDLAESEQLLDRRAERFVTLLISDLETTVGMAHVEMAKRVSPSMSGPRVEPVREESPEHQKIGLGADGVPSIQKWAGLRARFSSLAQEELTRDPHNSKDRWLRAYVEYREGDSPCGQWHVSEGVDEAFRERFQLEATKAGLALQSSLCSDPRDIWLHHVFLNLIEHKSKLLLGEHQDTGGTVTRICEASSIYCARLERTALANARVAPDSPSSQVSDAPSLVGSQDVPSQRDNRLERRKAVIMKVRDPERFTVLSIPEAALYFEVEARTIYRWLNEGKLRDGSGRGKVTIESIRRFEKTRSRKRRSAT